MAYTIIPLPGGRQVRFRVRPPDERRVYCSAPGCGRLVPRREAWRITATITPELMDEDVVETKDCYACSQACADEIYSERHI